ncbi:MAG: hypothetical protein JO114_06780, partial [Planctomycetaceae bacterium]|nr:hypothetical protein [Planctomycetaceae bacterium]
INQFISTAVAEKLSTLMTVQYLQERASRGDRARFDAVLAKIADAPADVADRIEGHAAGATAKLNAPPALGVRGLGRFPG